VGGGLCCAEKIPEISNEGGARAKNGGISGILRTAYRKRLYCKPMVVMESVHSEGVPLGDLNPSGTPNGGTQTRKITRFQKLISSICPP